MPVITLPDGSERSFANPVTVHDVAADIGAGLARAALAGVVDGRMVDTSFIIEHDATLAITTERDDAGLEVIRHSSAHLLAMAYNTELYRMPAVVLPVRLAQTTLIMLAFVGAAQSIIYLLLRRLDWLEAVKIKE